MPLVGTSQMLRAARQRGYAVPAFCAWNAESIQTILRVAIELDAPVILMSGPGEFPLLSPAMWAQIARTQAQSADTPVAIHLDHGDSLAMVAECLDAGFTSVMLDASDRPFAQNVALTRQAVQMAKAAGADIEAELGALGRADQTSVEAAGSEGLTNPQEAAKFVEKTGVDALAVSIGNKHGIYPGLPRLDFERLAAIAKRVAVSLVFHGGSSTPEDHIRRAVNLGVAKVNVASELENAFREDLKTRLSQMDPPPWLPIAMSEALDALAEVVRHWLQVTDASGKA